MRLCVQDGGQLRFASVPCEARIHRQTKPALIAEGGAPDGSKIAPVPPIAPVLGARAKKPANASDRFTIRMVPAVRSEDNCLIVRHVESSAHFLH